MKKLILSTLICCALNTQAQVPTDTTKATRTNVLEVDKNTKKRRHRTWDRISFGIFAVVTTYFFVRASR